VIWTEQHLSGVKHIALGMLGAIVSTCWSVGVVASAQEVLHDLVGKHSQWDTWIRKFAVVGDVTGDHVPDFIYGSPMPHMHRVRSGADWSTLSRYQSTYRPGWHDNHGVCVAGIGLWDDDDVPDYAVGAPNAFTLQFYEGAVRIFSGATHNLIQEITEHTHYDRMGSRVFGLGDLDGDGKPELATTSSARWHVRIYSAPDGGLLRAHEGLHAIEPPVAPYGDLDGDGGIDYLIGEWAWNQSISGGGRILLFSGRTGEELMSIPGRREREMLGYSVTAAGDWNDDGIEDIAAGAPGSWTAVGGDSCGVYVFSGVDGSLLRYFDGADYAHPEADFGHAIASGKDLNGDGFPDLVVGAPADDCNSATWRRGAVYVISGRTGAVLWQLHGPEDFDYKLGRLVYLIDDHDQDGLAEWVVSDPAYVPHAWIGKGRITIYRGAIGDQGAGCDTTPNSVGSGARLSAAGPISLRCNLLRFSVESAPAGSTGRLVYGTPGAPTPFGSGTLCIQGATHRAATVVTDAAGTAQIPIDLWQPPFSSGDGMIEVGDTVAFQFLYQDPAAGNRNASDSIVIRFVP